MKKLKLSSSFNLHAYPLNDVFEHVVNGLDFMENVGFEAADFTAVILKSLSSDYESLIERIVDHTSRRKVRFELCHLPYSVKIATDHSLLPEFCTTMHRAIDAAALLGVRYAVMHPNTVTQSMEEFDRKASYDSVMSHLAPFVEHANSVGLSVVVENMRVVHASYPTHRYCQDPDELSDVADALGIGVCWDFGHAHIGGLVQSDSLRYLGSRVKVLHVNDNTGYDDDHVPPFVGTLDWRDAMRGLSDIGFDGLFNYEIATSRIPESARESFARYLVAAAKEILALI